jgi:hypothetical protein
MIRFVCECGKQLQARAEDAGKHVICPSCNRQLTAPDAPPPPEGMQQQRPIHRDEPEWEEASEMDDRPRRQPAGNSGKAIACLVLGILSLFCNVLAGLPALILGLLALRDIGRSRGRLSGQGLAIAGIVTACACTLLSCVTMVPISIGLLLPAVQKVREAAARAESSNNLKQIALAMQSYNATYNSLPPPGITDPKRPRLAADKLLADNLLLSWRVILLPFLGEKHLYDQFKLDEPWDSPHNSRLLSQMPKVYASPRAVSPMEPGSTIYQVFVGNRAAFSFRQLTAIPRDFPDGTSNTILIVEAPAKPLPWTKPEDLEVDLNFVNKSIKRYVGSSDGGGFLVAMADGSVHWVRPEVSENSVKAAITRNGGEALGPDW